MARRLLAFALALGVLCPTALAAGGADGSGQSTLDRELRQRAQAPRGSSRVILTLAPGTSSSAGAALEQAIRGVRGIVGRRLSSIHADVAYVPDTALAAIGRLPGVAGVSLDRRVRGSLERTGATIGSTWVRENLGVDGTGVGIAIVDSGVASWHDDLAAGRVARFVDFVNFQPSAYDDYGHGTHVAGIIAGDGHDSGGRRRGIAPGATLLVEKVLDASGQGYISNVIAAIDYAIANKDAFRIRVLNLSVAAGVYESYNSDPLTLAARRAVEAGIVVVSAAGNLGKDAQGQPQYGGIGAPGNAPWVITVGASTHNGTVDRADDTIAGFSSRGPSAIDYQAKPDLVAPGVGIESIAEAGTTLWNTKPLMRLWGTVPTAAEPYLSLSGTSMAAPVVSGTIALMLQANPGLTPNLVKALLEFSAESHSEYNGLTQGAGFLNARGAVELARRMSTGAGPAGAGVPADRAAWSGHVIWGNRLVAGGDLRAAGTAWRADVIWGSDRTPEGAPVTLGAACARDECDGGVWSAQGAGSNVVWGAACGGGNCEDIAWGTMCDSGDCGAALAASGALDDADDIVWGAPPVWRHPRALPTLEAAR